MSESKHTPGPWRSGGCVVWGDVAGDSDMICDLSPPGTRRDPDTTEANARLIAAAPDLLEALRILVVQKPYKDGDGAAMFHAENIARAALARVEGR